MVEQVAFFDQLSSWLVILRVVGIKYFGVERKALKCSTSKMLPPIGVGYPLAELSRGYVSECSIGQPENGGTSRTGLSHGHSKDSSAGNEIMKSLRSLRKFGSRFSKTRIVGSIASMSSSGFANSGFHILSLDNRFLLTTSKVN